MANLWCYTLHAWFYNLLNWNISLYRALWWSPHQAPSKISWSDGKPSGEESWVCISPSLWELPTEVSIYMAEKKNNLDLFEPFFNAGLLLAQPGYCPKCRLAGWPNIPHNGNPQYAFNLLFMLALTNWTNLADLGFFFQQGTHKKAYICKLHTF